VAALDPLPQVVPAYAFGDPWVLRSERGLAMLAVLLVVAVVVWNGIIEGELPTEVTREGVSYREVASSTDRSLEELVGRLRDHQESLDLIAELDSTAVDALHDLDERLARLEDDSRQGSPEVSTESEDG
jgi:hypothetical protein